MNETPYIYALTNPKTNTVHYIGASYHPRKRLCEHIALSSAATRHDVGWTAPSPKDCWISSLRKEGLRPGLVILEHCSNGDSIAREDFWIDYHLDMGCKLMNTQRIQGKDNLHFSYYKKNRAAREVSVLKLDDGSLKPLPYKFIPFDLESFLVDKQPSHAGKERAMSITYTKSLVNGVFSTPKYGNLLADIIQGEVSPDEDGTWTGWLINWSVAGKGKFRFGFGDKGSATRWVNQQLRKRGVR